MTSHVQVKWMYYYKSLIIFILRIQENFQCIHYIYIYIQWIFHENIHLLEHCCNIEYIYIYLKYKNFIFFKIFPHKSIYKLMITIIEFLNVNRRKVGIRISVIRYFFPKPRMYQIYIWLKLIIYKYLYIRMNYLNTGTFHDPSTTIIKETWNWKKFLF